METITLTQLTSDELVTLIDNSIRNALIAIKTAPAKDVDQWFDLNGLCSYLPDKPAKATVYGWIQANSIPYHKGTKKLRFLKSEIDLWLSSGRNKMSEEIAAEALDFIRNQKRSNHGK